MGLLLSHSLMSPTWSCLVLIHVHSTWGTFPHFSFPLPRQACVSHGCGLRPTTNPSSGSPPAARCPSFTQQTFVAYLLRARKCSRNRGCICNTIHKYPVVMELSFWLEQTGSEHYESVNENVPSSLGKKECDKWTEKCCRQGPPY